jgi:glycosyltransferase involved in cell wall biosynthesis
MRPTTLPHWSDAPSEGFQNLLNSGASEVVPHIGARRLRVGLVMEQVLGHVTWYQNLRAAMTALDRADTRWVETSMYDPDGLLERLPVALRFVRASGRALLDTRRGLRGWRPDVLLFNTQKAAAFCQWHLLRTPSMLMTDVTPIQYDRMAHLYQHPVDRNPAIRLAKHWSNVVNFRLARALLPCSAWTRDSLVRDYGVPPDRVHVIPVGVDTQYWRPASNSRGSGRVQILFVGGHFERKGGRLLLDVFRSLRLHERADLHVVTRETVATSRGVTVHNDLRNNSDDLLRLYQRADLFVLPTLADCFGNASIEAMATGLPVITTAIGGVPDIVDEGRTGFLLAPGDRRNLARTLERLLDNAPLRAMMGEAARSRALTRFDSRTNAGRILDLANTLYHERTGMQGRW